MAENTSREITQLTIATAFIPEMREDIKELVRAIKGNNGNLGISARLAQNEGVVADLNNRMNQFTHSCERHRKETNDIINDRFDKLLNQLNSVSNKKIDQLVEKGRINEEEAREIRKDKRKFSFEFKKDFLMFIYGVAAGVAFRVIELIVSLFF
jgi:chemotaxis regulatin CheY-phosphate phosphatase CheZ